MATGRFRNPLGARRERSVAYARPAARRSSKLRLVIALVIAAFAVISYLGKLSENPVTGETQYVDLTPGQEIALGLQAAPEMARQHGGLHANSQAQDLVDKVGQRLVRRSEAHATPYEFDFHLLADDRTVNAFALPGGQVFITAALMASLETEGQLAGVLGHEIGHVVGRHGAEHMAKAKLTQGLTGAAVIAAYDPSSPSSRQTAAIAAMIGQLISMKYGRDDELESDRLGVRFTSAAGYDPRSMIRVMEILAAASEGARPPEFFSTHPNPDRRIQRIEEAIQEQFAGGAPADLEP